MKVGAGGGGLAALYGANAVRALAHFCAEGGDRARIAREVIGAVSPALFTAVAQMTACMDELRERETIAAVFLHALPDDSARDGSAQGAGSPAPSEPEA